MVGLLQFPSRKLVRALLYRPERSQPTWVVLRVDPCDLDVLGRLESPQGWLLRVWLGDVLGYEGSIILMPEPRGTTTSWSLLSYFWLRLLLVES
jgi:hypothetical protein